MTGVDTFCTKASLPRRWWGPQTVNSTERNVVAHRGLVTSGLFSAHLVAGIMCSQDCKRHQICQWKGNPALTQDTPLDREILEPAPCFVLSSLGLAISAKHKTLSWFLTFQIGALGTRLKKGFRMSGFFSGLVFFVVLGFYCWFWVLLFLSVLHFLPTIRRTLACRPTQLPSFKGEILIFLPKILPWSWNLSILTVYQRLVFKPF